MACIDKMYDCKTKPESPIAQGTINQTQIGFFLTEKLIYYYNYINLGNEIASSDGI